VRVVLEHRGEHPSRVVSDSVDYPKVGCTPQTLLNWVHRTEIDQGTRDSVTTTERERVNALEREVKERRRANKINEILKLPSAFFAWAQHRPPIQSMKDFVCCLE